MKELTQKRLKEALDYDPEAGIFVHKQSSGSAKAGKAAGCIVDGITYISIDKQRYKAARLAWLYTYGELPKGRISLITKSQGNKIANLRLTKRDTHPWITWSAKRQNYRISVIFDGKELTTGFADTGFEAEVVLKSSLHKYGYEEDYVPPKSVMIKNICHGRDILSRFCDPRTKPKDLAKRSMHHNSEKAQPVIKVRRIINIPHDITKAAMLAKYRSTPDLHLLLIKHRFEIDYNHLGDPDVPN